MLRWMTPFLVAIFAIGTAAAESPGATKTADGPTAAKPADSPAAAQPTDSPQRQARDGPATVKPAAAAKRAGNPAAPRRATVRAARQLPPGLPRAHYKYRTTVAPPPPPSTCAAAARGGRGRGSDVLFTPVDVAALRAAHLRHAAAAGLLDAARLLRYEPFLQL